MSADSAEAKGFAPGKLLLLGEHSVVYGGPALGFPLRRGVAVSLRPGDGRVEVSLEEGLVVPKSKSASPEDLVRKALGSLAETVDVQLHLEVPPMCGYGSSAAVAVALLRARYDYEKRPLPFPKQLWREALEVEHAAHAKPSGVDPAIVVWATPVLYTKLNEDDAHVEPQLIAQPLHIVAGWCGAHAGTKTSVTGLATLRDTHPQLVNAAMKTLSEATTVGSAALRNWDLPSLGSALNLAHGVLAGLELVGDQVEAAVRTARRLGALGAKMSGAGGGGGAWLAAFETEAAATYGAQTLERLGYTVMQETLGRSPT